jgi:beta-glucosidase
VRSLDAKSERAVKDLRGIERISLRPGEEKRVTFVIKPSRDLRYYDTERKAYAVDPGRYEVQIGASSADIRVKREMRIADR